MAAKRRCCLLPSRWIGGVAYHIGQICHADQALGPHLSMSWLHGGMAYSVVSSSFSADIALVQLRRSALIRIKTIFMDGILTIILI